MSETTIYIQQMGWEEFLRQKSQARELMQQDYQWMMSQEPAVRRWRCPQRWLIEFVYDSNENREPDELLRRPPLTQLYQDFFRHVGSPPPNHPSTQLSKLRAMEQRRDIRPDCITRFYMQQMGKAPQCRIIELLMEQGD